MGYDAFEKLCTSRNVTPYKVAKETGVSTSTLSSWKKGRYTPKQDKLQKIADYFGVSVDYLLGVQNSGPQTDHEWYINNETGEVAQEVFDDPDLRLLFDAARDSRPEDIRMAAEMLRRLKGTNPDG